jgi:hypothetical protein
MHFITTTLIIEMKSKPNIHSKKCQSAAQSSERGWMDGPFLKKAAQGRHKGNQIQMHKGGSYLA